MRSLSIAQEIYLADYDTIYPGVNDQATYHQIMSPYLDLSLKHTSISRDDIFNRPTSYLADIRFNTRLSNVSLSSISDPQKAIVLWSPFAERSDQTVTEFFLSSPGTITQSVPAKTWNADYADLLDRNYPRVSQTFLPSLP